MHVPYRLRHSNGLQWGQALEALLPFAVFQLDCKLKRRDCKSHDTHVARCLSLDDRWPASGIAIKRTDK